MTTKRIYQEDIATIEAGTELIATPCIVYSITVTRDVDGDATVSFSDSATAYDNDEACEKIITTAEQHTVQLTYPKGLPLDNGLSATSNLASTNVSVTYE